MDYEELKEEISALNNKYTELTKAHEDLQAEAESFKTENEKLLKELSDIKADNQKLKETNYTLARHFDTSTKKRSAGDILNDMFK